MGVAAVIALVSCVQAEIHAFEDYWPTSWNYSLPTQSYSVLTSLNGKLDPKHIGTAIDILSGSGEIRS